MSALYFACLWSGIWLLGCGDGSQPPLPAAVKRPQPRLVLLYATCTVNRSFLSPYNPAVTFTPNLDRFARESVVFGKHRTESGRSGIAFASIFTGTGAAHHGIFFQPMRLDDSVYDITEAFADGGYEVSYWGDNKMSNHSLNYGQAVPPKRAFARALRAADPELTDVLDRLAVDDGYRAFLMTAFTVTHGPYETDRLLPFCREFPTECSILNPLSNQQKGRYLRLYRENHHGLKYDFQNAKDELQLSDEDVSKLADLLEAVYKSRIWMLDELFGKLLDRLEQAGVLAESLIVFTADHGETLYREHAPFKWSHSSAVQADVLDVPLIVRSTDPSVEKGRFSRVTRSIDLFPTMAGLAGLQLPADPARTGIDLSDALRGDRQAPRLIAFSHTSILSHLHEREDVGEYRFNLFPKQDMNLTWVALRQGDTVWKHKNQGDGRFGFEAYDVSTDVAEEHDLFDAGVPHHQEMAEELRRYKASLVAAYSRWSEGSEGNRMGIEDADARERLKSLGYVK